jgi:hypothetical protein
MVAVRDLDLVTPITGSRTRRAMRAQVGSVARVHIGMVQKQPRPLSPSRAVYSGWSSHRWSSSGGKATPGYLARCVQPHANHGTCLGTQAVPKRPPSEQANGSWACPSANDYDLTARQIGKPSSSMSRRLPGPAGTGDSSVMVCSAGHRLGRGRYAARPGSGDAPRIPGSVFMAPNEFRDGPV